MYKNRITNYRSSSKFQKDPDIGPIVRKSFLDDYELRISEYPMQMYHGSKIEFEQFEIGDNIYTYDIIFTSLKSNFYWSSPSRVIINLPQGTMYGIRKGDKSERMECILFSSKFKYIGREIDYDFCSRLCEKIKQTFGDVEVELQSDDDERCRMIFKLPSHKYDFIVYTIERLIRQRNGVVISLIREKNNIFSVTLYKNSIENIILDLVN
tara:strand:- start:21 stop:650 length:630 start_codon:yes stop_codon:yes gene_type:complete